jgi:hypothetical protein
MAPWNYDDFGGFVKRASDWNTSPAWFNVIDYTGHPLTDWRDLNRITAAQARWVANNFDRDLSQYAASRNGMLVASVWDPKSQRVYSSTIPRGNLVRYLRARGQVDAKVWYGLQPVPPPGQEAEYARNQRFDAEDAALFLYEIANQHQVTVGQSFGNGEYDNNMWIAVYGRLKGTLGLKNTKLCTQSNKVPTCSYTAISLGIWFPEKQVDLGNLMTGMEDILDDPMPLADDQEADQNAMAMAVDGPECDTTPGRRRWWPRGLSLAARDGNPPQCPLSYPAPIKASSISFSLEHSGTATGQIPTTLPPEDPEPGSSTAAATSPAPTAPPSFGCTMMDPDPDAGKDVGYCECSAGTVTLTAPLLNISKPTIYSQSCEYSSWPASTTSISANLPSITNQKLCQVCGRYDVNEGNGLCTSMPNCTPQIPLATVTVASSLINVGTLTGTALSGAIATVLSALCPAPTQNIIPTTCNATKQEIITKIVEVTCDDVLGCAEASDGQLVVQVPTSSYNDTDMRDWMISAIATAAQYSAAGNHCHNVTVMYDQPARRGVAGRLGARDILLGAPILGSAARYLGLRASTDFGFADLSLARRESIEPKTKEMTICSAAYFYTADVWSQYWRFAAQPGATDSINALITFKDDDGGNFDCSFVHELVDALPLALPETLPGDIALDEVIDVACCVADDNCQVWDMFNNLVTGSS